MVDGEGQGIGCGPHGDRDMPPSEAGAQGPYPTTPPRAWAAPRVARMDGRGRGRMTSPAAPASYLGASRRRTMMASWRRVAGIDRARAAVAAALFATWFLWGTTYTAMHFAIIGLPPMMLGSGR